MKNFFYIISVFIVLLICTIKDIKKEIEKIETKKAYKIAFEEHHGL